MNQILENGTHKPLKKQLIFSNQKIWLFSWVGFQQLKSFLRKQLPEALRALGSEDRIYIKFRWTYAQALFLNDRASRDDVVESIAIHEELATTARRVLGPAYPLTTSIQDTFAQARERLASFDK